MGTIGSVVIGNVELSRGVTVETSGYKITVVMSSHYENFVLSLLE